MCWNKILQTNLSITIKSIKIKWIRKSLLYIISIGNLIIFLFLKSYNKYRINVCNFSLIKFFSSIILLKSQKKEKKMLIKYRYRSKGCKKWGLWHKVYPFRFWMDVRSKTKGRQWRYCLIGISIPKETRDNRLAEAAQLRSRGLIKLHIDHD